MGERRDVSQLSFTRSLPLTRDRKLRRHRRSLGMLEEAMPGNRLVELLRFEIEALEALPPDAAPTRST